MHRTDRPSTPDRQTLTIAAAIFAGLLCVYGLSYSGTFTADDEQLFASGAQTFALTGRLAALPVYGNARLQGSFGEVEPALAILGSLVYRLTSATESGSVQALFLLTPLWTALTAVAVFLTGRRWGYAPPLAAAAALLFGLGSMAWPYSKTFFRDPLAMLFVAGGWLCLEIALSRSGSLGVQLIRWAALTVVVAGGVLTKSIVIPLIPIVAAVAMLRIWQDGPRPRAQLALAAFFVAAFAALLARPMTGSFYRSSVAYLLWLAEWLMAVPHDGFWTAVWGALVSPGKGLAVYAPFTALALLSWVVAGRQAWPVLLGPTIWALAMVAAHSLFYDIAWANPQWGARYLLPALPGLAVAALPGMHWLRQRWPRGGWFVFGLVLGLGVLGQLPGALIAPPAYSAVVHEVDPGAYYYLAIWNPYYSAIAGHWRLVLSGSPWALAWVRTFPANSAVVTIVLLGLGGGAAAAALVLRSAFAGGPSARRTVAAAGLAVAAAALVPVSALWAYGSDPAYCGGRPEFKAAIRLLNASAGADDLIAVRGYLGPFWYCYFNDGRPRGTWAGLPTFDSPAGDGRLGDRSYLAPVEAEVATTALLESARARYRRLWFVTDFHTPTAPEALDAEGWLRQGYLLVGQWDFVGQRPLRVLLLDGQVKSKRTP